MPVMICDRCGDVVVVPEPCRCATPYDPVEVRRRLRNALRRGAAEDRRRLPHRSRRDAA